MRRPHPFGFAVRKHAKAKQLNRRPWHTGLPALASIPSTVEETPLFLGGLVEHLCEECCTCRQRDGLSSLAVWGEDLEPLTPTVAHLAGT